ncbi:MAG: STN domain-containing protein, partial [Tardiphaga sp.]
MTCSSGAVAPRLTLPRASWLGRAVALMAALFTLAAIVTATAAGDNRPAPAPLSFNIPRQPLAAALQAYSTVTGAQLLYESSAATGRVSTAVEGTFSRDHALRMLLTDTDLKVNYTRANSITLAPASIDGDEPPATVFARTDLTLDTLRVRNTVERADAGQLRAYEGVIQADIQQALKKDGRTRNGSYSAGIKLWI